ncbi:hypothetical protein HDU81_000412, partial [Chytriomyces hyalinus]
MDNHSAHFATTFGAPPTGMDQPDLGAMETTDPAQPLVPLEYAGITPLFSKEDVAEVLRCQPRGKAMGDDDVYGEMLAYSAEELKEVVCEFFRLL